MAGVSPIAEILDRQGVLILDGGLATELESQGYKLNHKLWSAQIMRTNPYAIKNVHLSYLKAGADCIISASYQASIQGCLDVGMKKWEARKLLESTVQIACEARLAYLNTVDGSSRSPLVAASIGPYGAYLTNGAEYTGDYGISKNDLHAFHAERWEILSETSADLMACETIPSFEEAEVLLELIKVSDQPAYVSFSCKDGKHINDGTPISECAELLKDCAQVVAIGVNCTAPELLPELIREIKAKAPLKPVVVYPNSGAFYDALGKTWSHSDDQDLALQAADWLSSGALLIGGCCRTSPQDIRGIRKALLD